MGTAKAVQEQIEQYLPCLNSEQQKAVLTVVKTFVRQQEADYVSPLEEPDFVAEMNRRVGELESGKAKGSTWKEVKSKAQKALKVGK